MTNSAGDFQRKKKEKRRIKSESPASENKNIFALAPACAPTRAETIAMKTAISQTYLPRYIHCMGPQYLHSVKFNLILHAKRVSFWTSMLTEVPKLAFEALTNRTPLRNREPVESISSPGSRRKRHCVGFLNVFSLNCVSSIKAKRGGRPNSFAGKKPMKTFYILL